MSKPKYPDLIPQLRQERFQIAIIEELVELNQKIDKILAKQSTDIVKPSVANTVITEPETPKPKRKRTVKKDTEVK